MTSREQFEEWFKPRKERMKSDGICTLNIVRYRGMAWAGWQASREAVEVELPTRVDCCNVPFAGYSWNACLEESEKRIRAAGIKVIKGEKKNG